MRRVGIIGAGNLGRSVATLFENNLKVNESIAISRKSVFDFKTFRNIDNILRSNILVLCVKPEDVRGVLEEIKNTRMSYKLISECLIISFVTGIPLSFYEKQLGKFPVIRCMADISVSQGEGVVIYMCNNNINEYLRDNFIDLINGPNILEVKNEKLLDVSTVLNGCTPAFISYLFREFINFGVDNGFSKDESLKLFLSTVKGTTKLLEKYSIQEIINMVSSPNGITTKGISFLESGSTAPIISSMLEYSLSNIKKID